MDGDELGRRLSDAFDARARSGVPDDRVPPPLRLPEEVALRRHGGGHGSRWWAPVAAAAAVLVAVAVGVGVRSGGHDRPTALGGSTSMTAPVVAPVSAASSVAPAPSATRVAGTPVRVASAVISDGSVVGVGLPISVLLSRPIRDARAFAAATRVTVNGTPVQGGWFFQRKYQDPGHPVEADYRLRDYWPGHAKIHLGLAVKGVSAGSGLVFANDLSLDFSTGRANVATVDDASHRMTVVSDGRVWGSFPVSLGAANTPTTRGTKVIMEKGRSICMSGPGYHECGVTDTQRLTYAGEYLHAAPWNCTGSPGCTGPQNNIGNGNSSNGCTNLTPNDAAKLYHFLAVGDVVQFPNADGPLMQLGDGYGAWNVPWSQWRTGGLYRVG